MKPKKQIDMRSKMVEFLHNYCFLYISGTGFFSRDLLMVLGKLQDDIAKGIEDEA